MESRDKHFQLQMVCVCPEHAEHIVDLQQS